MDRSIEGAVVHDPALAADRISEMVLKQQNNHVLWEHIKAKLIQFVCEGIRQTPSKLSGLCVDHWNKLESLQRNSARDALFPSAKVK